MKSVFIDLCSVTKLTPRPGESHDDFASRMHERVNKLDDKEWEALSREAQDWNNLVVSPFEQRGAFLAAGNGEAAAEIEIPRMEGFKPLTVADADAEFEAAAPVRRSPGRVQPAKAAEAPTPKPRASRKAPVQKAAHTNSKSPPAEPTFDIGVRVTALEEQADALRTRLFDVENQLTHTIDTLVKVGGRCAELALLDPLPKEVPGNVPMKKAKPTIGKIPDKKGRLVPPPKSSPVAIGKQVATKPTTRPGSVASKILETLAATPMTTSTLVEAYKIKPDGIPSFRQRLVELKRKGLIMSPGRGEPWQVVS